MILPDRITTASELRHVVRTAKTLAAVLRMSGYPISSMPPREDMARVLALLAEFAERATQRRAA